MDNDLVSDLGLESKLERDGPSTSNTSSIL